MANKNALYKCSVCGNIVSVLDAGKGDLFCCGEKMQEVQLLKSNEGYEKHKPVMEKEGSFVIVNVGSVDHPMDDDHYIMLIQIFHNGNLIKEKILKPGMRPRARFMCRYDLSELSARAYCNKHGYWEND